jgi:hypothetical protein
MNEDENGVKWTLLFKNMNLNDISNSVKTNQKD